MDWDSLQYFQMVARHGTLARAGQALHVDATTVSRRVSALESALQQTLFERAPTGFVLTAAGRALVACRGVCRWRVEIERLQRRAPCVADLVRFAALDQQQAAGGQPRAPTLDHRQAGARHHVQPLFRRAVAVVRTALAAAGGDHHLRGLHATAIEQHAEAAAETQSTVLHARSSSRETLATMVRAT